jgi:predicted nucleic acid-binding protein
MSFVVLFDTSVLAPARLNDLMLSLAFDRTYVPKWSSEIVIELERYLVRRGLKEAAIEKRLLNMANAFPTASVENFQSLAKTLRCPDPNDNHVLAAAIVGGAGALVTFNSKDFPQNLFENYGIDLLHPDDFLRNQYTLHPETVNRSLADLGYRWHRPDGTVQELVRSFERPLPQFASLIASNSAEIDFYRTLRSAL